MLTWQKTTLSTLQRQLSVWTDGPLSELPRLCPSSQSFSLPLWPVTHPTKMGNNSYFLEMSIHRTFSWWTYKFIKKRKNKNKIVISNVLEFHLQFKAHSPFWGGQNAWNVKLTHIMQAPWWTSTVKIPTDLCRIHPLCCHVSPKPSLTLALEEYLLQLLVYLINIHWKKTKYILVKLYPMYMITAKSRNKRKRQKGIPISY